MIAAKPFNMFTSRVSRTYTPITCKLRAPPRKPKTGGGGNDDQQNNSNDWKHLEKIRNYNLGTLYRCYESQPEITEHGLVGAMVMRWGRPYIPVVIVPESTIFMSVHFQPRTFDRNDKKSLQELQLTLNVLNTYSLGGEFIDYIKFDSSVRDPSMMQTPYIVSINIPVSGDRLCEWI